MMRILNVLPLLILIGSGLNWALIGMAHIDLVAAFLGIQTAETNAVYVIAGMAATFQLLDLSHSLLVAESLLRHDHNRFVFPRSHQLDGA